MTSSFDILLFIVNIFSAYLDTGDYNIILMDWSTLSAGPWYITAVNNSYLVGRILARFLTVLDRRKLIPLENVHVIGFSLGAEVAGFAGKAMPKSRYNQGLRRIRLPIDIIYWSYTRVTLCYDVRPI